MAMVSQQRDEKRYGPNGKNVRALLQRLVQIEWFSALERPQGQRESEDVMRSWMRQLGVEPECTFVWMTKGQLSSFIEEMRLADSRLWSPLAHIPTKLRDQAEHVGRSDILAQLADTVPAILFHSAFDGAFRELEPCGLHMVKIAIGFVLYVGGLACAWEALADLEGWETNPFLPLVDVFARGHWPLGWFGDHVYVI